MLRQLQLTFLIGTLICGIIQQTSAQEKNHNNYNSFEIKWNEIIDNDSQTNKQILDKDTIVIIKFKGDPLCLIKENDLLKSGKINTIEKTFERFQSDLNNLGNSSGLKNASKNTLRNTYKKAYLGASVKIPASLIPELKKLDYVENIYPNSIATIPVDSLNESKKGYANKFAYQYTGKGVKIGILDTGIDYTHPALGGGFGEKHKIAGGYDFVNNDDDPMDDEGHGTHVAGIIGAENEEMRGYAPDAELFAVKILNEWALGTEEWLLNGLEWVLDPNGDGDYSDKMDVVNISLGLENGSPDDPASVAVDNLVENGIICCVAAGNAISYAIGETVHDVAYFTISSPGSAEKAITVNAIDNERTLWNKAARGPNRKTFSIKPDISGLGKDIYSTDLNGEYSSKTGTSMSTPQITATCALILEKNKDLVPEEIKSIICATADTSYGFLSSWKYTNDDFALANCIETGAGYVNIDKALNSETILSDFKWEIFIDDFTQDIANTNKTFLIENNSDTEQTYIFDNYYLDGIILNPEESMITIPPNSIDSITYNAEIYIDALPQPGNNSENISGKLNINSESDSLAITWSLAVGAIVNFTFSEPLMPENLTCRNIWSKIVLTNAENCYEKDFIIFSDELNASTIVLPGKYNLVAIGGPSFNPHVFVKSELLIEKDTTIYIDFDECINLVALNGLMPDGNPFEKKIMEYFYLDFPEGFVYPGFIINILKPAEVLFNSFDNIDLHCGVFGMEKNFNDYSIDIENDSTLYMIDFDVINSIKKDTVLTNIPADFESVTWNLSNPNADSLNLTYKFKNLSDEEYNEPGKGSGNYSWFTPKFNVAMGFNFYITEWIIPKNKKTVKLFYTPYKDSKTIFSSFEPDVNYPPVSLGDGIGFTEAYAETPYFSYLNEGIYSDDYPYCGEKGNIHLPRYLKNTIEIGQGLIYPSFWLGPSQDQIEIRNRSHFGEDARFLFKENSTSVRWNDHLNSNIYIVNSSGNTLKYEEIYHEKGITLSNLQFSNEKIEDYGLLINTPYKFNENIFGHNSCFIKPKINQPNLHFTTGVPELRLLTLTDQNNEVKSSFNKNDSIFINTVIYTERIYLTNEEDIKIYVKPHGELIWKKTDTDYNELITTQNTQKIIYCSSMFSALELKSDDSVFDIKIELNSKNGGGAYYYLNPAFVIENGGSLNPEQELILWDRDTLNLQEFSYFELPVFSCEIDTFRTWINYSSENFTAHHYENMLFVSEFKNNAFTDSIKFYIDDGSIIDSAIIYLNYENKIEVANPLDPCLLTSYNRWQTYNLSNLFKITSDKNATPEIIIAEIDNSFIDASIDESNTLTIQANSQDESLATIIKLAGIYENDTAYTTVEVQLRFEAQFTITVANGINDFSVYMNHSDTIFTQIDSMFNIIDKTNEPYTYHVFSTNEELVKIIPSDTALILGFQKDKTGISTINIYLEILNHGLYKYAFKVNVLSDSIKNIYVQNTINDTLLQENFLPYYINLNNVFYSDEELSYSVNSDNPDLVGLAILDSFLVVFPNSKIFYKNFSRQYTQVFVQAFNNSGNPNYTSFFISQFDEFNDWGNNMIIKKIPDINLKLGYSSRLNLNTYFQYSDQYQLEIENTSIANINKIEKNSFNLVSVNKGKTKAKAYLFGDNGGMASQEFNIIVHNFENFYKQELICEGDSILLGGVWQKDQGMYSDTVYSNEPTGIDSIFTVVLEFYENQNSTEYIRICRGDSYKGWNEEGQYFNTFTSIYGCDSVVTTNLSFYPEYNPIILSDGNTLTSGNTYSSYQWYNSEGEISGATENKYTITKSDDYYLVIVDENGCTQTSDIIHATYTSIESTNISEFRYKIVPNPNNGKFSFRIDSALSEELTIKLVNSVGQVIEVRMLKPEIATHLEEFDISNLSKGIYHLILSSTNIEKSEKIIVN